MDCQRLCTAIRKTIVLLLLELERLLLLLLEVLVVILRWFSEGKGAMRVIILDRAPSGVSGEHTSGSEWEVTVFGLLEDEDDACGCCLRERVGTAVFSSSATNVDMTGFIVVSSLVIVAPFLLLF
jgi:hypothetical protein